MVLFFICITTLAIMWAIKKHIDVLALAHILVSKGVDVNDSEMREACVYVVKKLFKTR